VACLLVGLGARRLSMSPVSAARVRLALRNSHISSLEELARTALKSDSPQTVFALATELLSNTYPDLRPEFVSV
jgi:phosphoenolpyruvate-protein kinase (PTS system EI component)